MRDKSAHGVALLERPLRRRHVDAAARADGVNLVRGARYHHGHAQGHATKRVLEHGLAHERLHELVGPKAARMARGKHRHANAAGRAASSSSCVVA